MDCRGSVGRCLLGVRGKSVLAFERLDNYESIGWRLVSPRAGGIHCRSFQGTIALCLCSTLTGIYYFVVTKSSSLVL